MVAAGIGGVVLGRKSVKAQTIPKVNPNVVPMAPRSVVRKQTYQQRTMNKPR
jgi:hypothetical protein